MLTVHHLNNSRSFRVVFLCEELGLDYKLVNHQRDPETQRSPDSLNKIHPIGRGPTIDHDGKIIIESDAILEYICQKLGGGRLSHGPDSAEYAEYLQALAFAEAGMMSSLVFDLIYAWTGGGNEALKGFYDAEIIKTHQYLNDTFEDRDFILKSGFSAADVNLCWTLEFTECRALLNPYPRLKDYLARLRARPAYQRTITRGGPQDLSVFNAGTV